MALLPLFSRRKRQADYAGIDVFTYDTIPPKVRVQLFMNVWEAMGAVSDDYNNTPLDLARLIVKELREELGTNNLTGDYNRDEAAELESWFLNIASTSDILDTLELWCLVAGTRADTEGWRGKEQYEDNVARVNARLLEAGIGYAITEGMVVEKANELLHTEAVLPALHLLAERRFSSANEEYREAHRAFRAGEYEDCITDCLKAFESVMKVIAVEQGWSVPATASAKVLIAALFEHEFVPSFMRSQFDGLRSLLESSVPTTRNRAGGHGKGAEEWVIPPSLAALQLHQTGALIVFLGALDSAF